MTKLETITSHVGYQDGSVYVQQVRTWSTYLVAMDQKHDLRGNVLTHQRLVAPSDHLPQERANPLSMGTAHSRHPRGPQILYDRIGSQDAVEKLWD